MTHTADRQKLIDKIRVFPELLEKKLNNYNEKQLDIAVQPGEWTIRQIVHHIADAHFNGFIRMKLVLTESKPILKPYDQDSWAQLSDVNGPIQDSLKIIQGLHERWANLLTSLPEESWSREGVHLENGLVNLDNLLESYVNHGETHLNQIDKLAIK